mmetsp:Transcript_16873/g.48481  ORF Transcript_16873/g.48481 Transcript_16873/m.48481 type:complete len:430 (+) Transcript_16873:1398-2687(+)
MDVCGSAGRALLLVAAKRRPRHSRPGPARAQVHAIPFVERRHWIDQFGRLAFGRVHHPHPARRTVLKGQQIHVVLTVGIEPNVAKQRREDARLQFVGNLVGFEGVRPFDRLDQRTHGGNAQRGVVRDGASGIRLEQRDEFLARPVGRSVDDVHGGPGPDPRTHPQEVFGIRPNRGLEGVESDADAEHLGPGTPPRGAEGRHPLDAARLEGARYHHVGILFRPAHVPGERWEVVGVAAAGGRQFVHPRHDEAVRRREVRQRPALRPRPPRLVHRPHRPGVRRCRQHGYDLPQVIAGRGRRGEASRAVLDDGREVRRGRHQDLVGVVGHLGDLVGQSRRVRPEEEVGGGFHEPRGGEALVRVGFDAVTPQPESVPSAAGGYAAPGVGIDPIDGHLVRSQEEVGYHKVSIGGVEAVRVRQRQYSPVVIAHAS